MAPAPRRSARISALPAKASPAPAVPSSKGKRQSHQKGEGANAEPIDHSAARIGDAEAMDVDREPVEDSAVGFAPPRLPSLRDAPISDLRSTLAPAPPASHVGSTKTNNVPIPTHGVQVGVAKRKQVAQKPSVAKTKPCICSTESCGRGFTRRSDLLRHERIHSNDK